MSLSMKTVNIDGNVYTLNSAIELLYKKVMECAEVPITSSLGVASLFSEKEKTAKVESFYVVYVDHGNTLIKKQKLSTGIEEQTAVYPRQIIREALKQHATGIILVHNHPSGSPAPSIADKQITESVKKGCNFLDIRLLDHVIISPQGHYSFRENGLIV